MESAIEHGREDNVIGDLLLTWISETGSGKIADFRARAAWLARTANLELHESATGRWLRDVASLGHCEVDWDRGLWAIAPSVITRLPLADGLAVLSGSRRPRLIRELDDADVYTERVRRSGSDRDIPAPSTIVIPYERAQDLKDAAGATSATYIDCSAVGIADLLRPTTRASPGAPPAYDWVWCRNR